MCHGRPTGGKEYIPILVGGAGRSNGQANEAWAEMVKAFQRQNDTLLQAMQEPNSLLEKIATQAISSHQNSVDMTVNPLLLMPVLLQGQ